jgi:hypothetical protein
MSQMNPIHVFPSYFFKIRFKYCHHIHPGSSQWSLSFTLSYQNVVSPSLLYAPMRAHLNPVIW